MVAPQRRIAKIIGGEVNAGMSRFSKKCCHIPICIVYNDNKEKPIPIQEVFMKLTDELKKKIDNAKSEEEVKSILEEFKGGVEEAGLILNDEELDSVAGGGGLSKSYQWSR